MYNTHCLLGFLHILAIVGCVKKEKNKIKINKNKREKKEKQTAQGMEGVGVAQKIEKRTFRAALVHSVSTAMYVYTSTL